MAGGIDPSKFKPRQLRGTPASKFIHRMALGTLGVCSVIGYLMTYLPGIQRMRTTGILSEEQIARDNDKRVAIAAMYNQSFIAQQSKEGIQKRIDIGKDDRSLY